MEFDTGMIELDNFRNENLNRKKFKNRWERWKWAKCIFQWSPLKLIWDSDTISFKISQGFSFISIFSMQISKIFKFQATKSRGKLFSPQKSIFLLRNYQGFVFPQPSTIFSLNATWTITHKCFNCSKKLSQRLHIMWRGSYNTKNRQIISIWLNLK